MIVDTPELAKFRAEVRQWAEANRPADDWRSRLGSDGDATEAYLELQREYRGRLKEAGYLAAHWPKEYGGAGLSAGEQLVLKQELARVGIPPVDVGIGMHHAAATIMVHGTPEQKEHLKDILDGQIWCQGFSEPNAGSDLASLQCRAVRDGDEYVVNGQKIWSSGAASAAWCLLLARTDSGAPKHKGISVFLVDMKSPGLEVRPIRQATGGAEFCEIFFTDCRVPAANRLGPENDGWRISQTTLSTERGSMIMDNHRNLVAAINELITEMKTIEIAPGRTAWDDPGIRQELGERAAEVEALGMLTEQVVGQMLNHGEMGPEGSILKLFYSEIAQRFTGLATRVRGAASAVDPGPRGYFSTGPRSWFMDHIGSWVWTIAAGSNEIQRNIISERILGLPREPSGEQLERAGLNPTGVR
jgi:alkylation response protein AidB-like acyl-CoA dehydrogenase